MRFLRERVLLATAGTWGDLLPLLQLGKELQRRGHAVVLACSRAHHEWVQHSGLEAAEFDGDFGNEVARRQASAWDQWPTAPPSRAATRTLTAQLERNSLQLAALAREADLLLASANCPEGRFAHELTGTPWISVVFTPREALRHPHARAAGTGGEPDPMIGELIDRLGLRGKCEPWRASGRSRPSLFPCSRAFGTTTDSETLQTGFWFYEDPAWATWTPDDRLRRFMEDGEPPLVLAFSSRPLRDPRASLEAHVRAAQILGHRIVIQRGWSGFLPSHLPRDSEPDRIYMADFLPHDWFFPRAAAVITDGGPGTLGRALRHASPLVIEPYGNDQLYNALLVKRLGLGVVVHTDRLHDRGVAEAIDETLALPGLRKRLAAAATLIAAEEGISHACNLIEGRLARAPGHARHSPLPLSS